MASLFGLQLRPTDERAAKGMALAAIAVITAYILLLDAVLFRAHLLPGYVAFYAGPDLALRIGVTAIKTVWEEVAYRLIVMTVVVVVGGLIWRKDGKPHPAVFVAAILLAQLANILLKATPAMGSEFVYIALRFYLPGLVWGWLYWRHGFLTNLIAHPLTHVALQPLLLVALRA